MKNDKLIPGIVLVLIGAAFLLCNFGYLHFYWYNIFHLWPIFLVIGGINLVFAHNKAVWATILKISVLVLGFGLLFFGNFGNRSTWWPGFRYHYSNNNNNNDWDDDDDNDDDDSTSRGDIVKMTGNGNFNEAYTADMKTARLNLSGGGTTYTLNDTTNQLFKAFVREDNSHYELTRSKDDSVNVVDFHMKNHHGFHWDSDKNAAEIRLNPNPIWDVNVDAGATKLDFDLTKFKVRGLKIHGGAASFNIKLGQPFATTEVDISTGVSGVDINIPQNAACSIETDSGLSDNHFEGFVKQSDNNYETTNYAAAKTKIHIHISGGLSDFKVRRY